MLSLPLAYVTYLRCRPGHGPWVLHVRGKGVASWRHKSRGLARAIVERLDDRGFSLLHPVGGTGRVLVTPLVDSFDVVPETSTLLVGPGTFSLRDVQKL